MHIRRGKQLDECPRGRKNRCCPLSSKFNSDSLCTSELLFVKCDGDDVIFDLLAMTKIK